MTDIGTLLYGDGKPPPAQGIIVCSPFFLSAYNVERDFYGRDWRRLKREHRKAAKRVKLEQRGKPSGIAPDSANWWRNA